MILAIMVGCGGNVNSSENTQKNKYIENDTQEVLTEGDEEKETQGEKIKYYDSLDNHAQSIYDKFIEWNVLEKISSLLEMIVMIYRGILFFRMKSLEKSFKEVRIIMESH